MGGGSERADRLRLLQQEDKGEAPGLVLSSCSRASPTSALSAEACVVAHGGVQLMLRAAGDEALRHSRSRGSSTSARTRSAPGSSGLGRATAAA